MTELNVVATIPVKPDAAEEVRAALQTLVAATRDEEGHGPRRGCVRGCR